MFKKKEKDIKFKNRGFGIEVPVRKFEKTNVFYFTIKKNVIYS